MSSSKPFTAQEARSVVQRLERKSGRDINFTLTIQRLFALIRSAAQHGNDSLEFKAPSFVLDGCIGDPIVLAKQLKIRLRELGYKVKRNLDTLYISWGDESGTDGG